MIFFLIISLQKFFFIILIGIKKCSIGNVYLSNNGPINMYLEQHNISTNEIRFKIEERNSLSLKDESNDTHKERFDTSKKYIQQPNYFNNFNDSYVSNQNPFFEEVNDVEYDKKEVHISKTGVQSFFTDQNLELNSNVFSDKQCISKSDHTFAVENVENQVLMNHIVQYPCSLSDYKPYQTDKKPYSRNEKSLNQDNIQIINNDNFVGKQKTESSNHIGNLNPIKKSSKNDVFINSSFNEHIDDEKSFVWGPFKNPVVYFKPKYAKEDTDTLQISINMKKLELSNVPENSHRNNSFQIQKNQSQSAPRCLSTGISFQTESNIHISPRSIKIGTLKPQIQNFHLRSHPYFSQFAVKLKNRNFDGKHEKCILYSPDRYKFIFRTRKFRIKSELRNRRIDEKMIIKRELDSRAKQNFDADFSVITKIENHEISICEQIIKSDKKTGTLDNIHENKDIFNDQKVFDKNKLHFPVENLDQKINSDDSVQNSNDFISSFKLFSKFNSYIITEIIKHKLLDLKPSQKDTEGEDIILYECVFSFSAPKSKFIDNSCPKAHSEHDQVAEKTNKIQIFMTLYYFQLNDAIDTIKDSKKLRVLDENNSIKTVQIIIRCLDIKLLESKYTIASHLRDRLGSKIWCVFLLFEIVHKIVPEKHKTNQDKFSLAFRVMFKSLQDQKIQKTVPIVGTKTQFEILSFFFEMRCDPFEIFDKILTNFTQFMGLKSNKESKFITFFKNNPTDPIIFCIKNKKSIIIKKTGCKDEAENTFLYCYMSFKATNYGSTSCNQAENSEFNPQNLTL